MTTTTTAPLAAHPLPEFRNEPYLDFTQPANRAAMEAALASVRARLGRQYPILLAGSPLHTGDLLRSVNPSRPSEVIGIHEKASADLARQAVDAAHAFFPTWSATPASRRIELVLNAAAILRRRKLEFDSWLVLEAGKSWNEAEADVSEAIDFCEYYARQMAKLAAPVPTFQLPGERSEMVYIPLGAGIIIPPWNFPLAILAGMTVAALVAGNTVVIKPSSDTPTIAAQFASVLEEAGFPAGSFSLLVGSGSVVGDVLVTHPKTRFVSFTGSREIGLRINELAAKAQPGQLWIKRVVAEMGGKDAIVVDKGVDVADAVKGVVASAFGYQGQKCSACSRAIVHEEIYDQFLDQLRQAVSRLTIGPADDPAFAMGPVINDGAMKNILSYIETGKSEGRLIAGGNRAPGDGFFLEPTVIADIAPNARIFREEIFGPVLAVTKARDFDHALQLANDSDYGLTGAAYTPDPARIDKAKKEFFVGNLYLNRKCTGAMVGVHPFGGFNMSGTDSKAGGPDYLLQFLQAKSIAEKLL